MMQIELLVLGHLPYSTDLVPCNFALLPGIKDIEFLMMTILFYF